MSPAQTAGFTIASAPQPGGSTTTSTTTGTTTTTTTTTTSHFPKDFPCGHKKGKKLECQNRNMHTGMTLVNYIMDMSLKERAKIKAIDVTNNPGLSFEVLMSIIGHLPSLSSLTARHNGWTIIPSNLFANNPKIKNVDISDNEVQCIRNVFKNLKMKKMTFEHNAMLQEAAGGARKGKKSKLAKYIEAWNDLPRDLCYGTEDAGVMT